MTTQGQPTTAEGYESFFGLNEAPFSLAPDPRFLFASASHSAALAQVAYAVQRREPLVVITGEIGTGKTLLCRTVLKRLQRKTFLSVINDPLLDRDDLLKQLLQDFGVISKDRTRLNEVSRHELVQALHAFLGSLSPIEAHAVVIIDEAQHLQPDVLEQIRLLSNIDDSRGTLLQIVLVGQTDLEPVLSRPELRQLQQRVSRRFVLEPLNRDEVAQYIEHRLTLARVGTVPSQAPGATELARELAEWMGTKPGVEFAPDAIHAVSELSTGIPRVINLLCDRSLEEAHASRLRIIDRRVVETAARALGIGAKTTPVAQPDPVTIARGVEAGRDESPDESPDKSTVAQAATAQYDESNEPVDEATVTFTSPSRSATAARFPKYVVIAASIALVSAAVLFGVRRAGHPASGAPASAAVSPAPASGARSEQSPARNDTSVPEAVPAGTPTPPQAAASTPSIVAVAPAGALVEVLVASFRTEARATAAAAEVAALGLPARQRASDGWQQVLCGPFASRVDAEEAQQRLERAGLTGSQIVTTTR